MNPKELPALEIFRHREPIQLRFSDIDVVGHVNNINFFSYYDTGKAAFMTNVLGKNINWDEVDTVVANVDCAFIAPILWGEKIEVLTACVGIHDKSFRLLQMLRNSESGEVKSVCETVMVSFDPATQKVAPLSEAWRNALGEVISK
ncbi:MAG: acyl-CoA thioesterase [Muribaculaceae bacterium]|nr:acyl-CoA thioesterase [Muribaculaceae bacterium]